MIVVDASVALAWLFPDESEDLADRVFRIVETEGGVVPPIWSLEVGNGLVTAEKRGRIRAKQISEAIGMLGRLPIRTAESSRESDFGQVLSLARRLGVTSYDAAYVEVSLRTSCRFATLDSSLKRAAKRAGVEVLQ